MKLLAVVGTAVLINIVCLCSASIIPWPPKSYYFDQTIDHFSFSPNPINYKQKVLFEDKWWDTARGPIFFYCGNEGPIEAFWNNTGFMFEAAKEFRALVVFGEHRYYGESLPFGPNKSFQQPNIQYLSIEQALADYAYLIEDMRKHFKAPARSVIAFGGSYGGQLATYMRFKYPNQVLGSVAASAPIYWVAGLGQFHKFFEVITEDCRSYDSRCPRAISAAYKTIQDLAQQGSEGLAVLSKSFALCKPLANVQEVDHLMRWIRNGFVMMAMMDYPYESSFMGHLPANPINKSCDAMLKNSGLVGLREAVAVFYNDSTLQCFSPEDLYIQCADITGCGLGPDSLAWDFQVD
jgi:dipeptidyl-peptidase-2